MTLSQARAYRDRIVRRVPADYSWFQPHLTLFASSDLNLNDLREAAAVGLLRQSSSTRLVPRPTVTRPRVASVPNDLYDVLSELGLRLLVHAESNRTDIDLFDREAAFLEDELAPLVAARPELLVTLEHVSTAAGVAFVDAHQHVAATVTPHHLARDRGDLLADGMKPDLYCKPIINSPEDRAALVRAVTAVQTSFVLGTDSAPHPSSAKYGPKVAAGVFNAPYGLEAVAEVFHRANALDRLDAFVSTNGCALYGVDQPTERLVLQRLDEPAEVQHHLTTERGDEVVFFGVEEAAVWRISPLVES
ncbi:MAG: hypothetical protein R2706_05995 [Acidimicrobiales bacterium]